MPRPILMLLLISTAGFAQQEKEDKHIALERQSVRDFEAHHTLSSDAVLNGYLAFLTSKLSPGVSVRLVDAAEENAAAIPGGYVAITTGLLLRARNEAELAGVLAHLAAHATAPVEGLILAWSDSGICMRFATRIPEAESFRQRERNADQAAVHCFLPPDMTHTPCSNSFRSLDTRSLSFRKHFRQTTWSPSVPNWN